MQLASAMAAPSDDIRRARSMANKQNCNTANARKTTEKPGMALRWFVQTPRAAPSSTVRRLLEQVSRIKPQTTQKTQRQASPFGVGELPDDRAAHSLCVVCG
jgi:hypothetical protein